MATADTPTRVREHWLPDNPWVWQLVGLGSSGAALLWSRLLLEVESGRYLLLLLGLLAAGVGLILRLNAPGGSYLDELSPKVRRRALAWLRVSAVLLGGAVTLLLVASGLDRDIPWTFGQVAFLNFVTLPGAVYLFLFTDARLKHARRTISKAQESGLLLLFAAATLFLSSWALYGTVETELAWDTLRMALALFALAAYVGAWLAFLPQGPRRLVLSLLVVLHFSAILHAVLSAPPGVPWLVGQAWVRLYRPYLEFMHLNNAYQFYAPEPSPSAQIWFYIEYDCGTPEKPEKLFHWLKIPDIKPNGVPNYALGLSHQRRIAMSELTVRYDNNSHLGRYSLNYRPFCVPNPPEVRVGQLQPEVALRIPIHPSFAMGTQFEHTVFFQRDIIAGYARHVIRQPHPSDPTAKGVRAKVYRIRHMILPRDMAAQGGIHPEEPMFYLPFYQGQFDRDGTLLDEPQWDTKTGYLLRGDPYLYWLLPFVYEPAGVLPEEARVYGWALKHAGDPNWIRNPGRKHFEAQEVGPPKIGQAP